MPITILSLQNFITENVYVLILILILLLLNFIIIYIHSKKKIKHYLNVISIYEEKEKKKNIKHTSKDDIELYNSIKNSFDIIMKEKMNFYFNRFFLPKYAGKKEIDKKLISDTKEKFYTDVVFATPDFIKNDLQELYGKKAFDAYILQFYFNYLNNYDRKIVQANDALGGLGSISEEEIKNIVQLGKY